jgi:hypothetical protein
MVEDSALIALAKNCEHLRSIDMRGCFKITRDGLIAFVRKCLHLKHISFPATMPGGAVWDDALVAIAETCKNLLSIDLSQSNSITERGMIAFIEQFPGLEKIGLPHYAANNTLIVIGDHCKNLRSLMLPADNNTAFKWLPTYTITNEEMTATLQLLPKLEQLDLTGMKDPIRDETLIAIAKNCPELQSLSLRCVPEKEPNLLGLVLANFNKLKQLTIVIDAPPSPFVKSLIRAELRNCQKIS